MTPEPTTTPGVDDQRDRGATTIWVVGLTVLIGIVGFLSLSVFVPYGERRNLAAAADQAAQAGATALDADVRRSTGERRLDPDLARERARDNLASQNIPNLLDGQSSIVVEDDRIIVTLSSEVDPLITRFFDPGAGPLTVTVTAVGLPRQDTP